VDIVVAGAGDQADLQRLLEVCGLPTADLATHPIGNFLVLREGPVLVAAVGLEPAGDAALLRSLAVSELMRGVGVGAEMVKAAEGLARGRGIGSLYLFTTTAGDYFARLGYRRCERSAAPEAIRTTPQFRGLSPSSSAFMVKSLEPKLLNVLFLCTGNSARSILAEAIINNLSISRGRFRGYSAGSHPKGEVHPLALELLRRYGLATDRLRSKSWDEFAAPNGVPLDFVFTVCDKAAAEQCPLWPGQPMTAHWGVPDPAAVEGSEEHKWRAFQDAYLVLRRRIELFASLPLASLSELALRARLAQIGQE
jgi:protein-tyrosine-phosphatase/N-acetylglutamate synthase-like GNAT family acetyltransferase